MGTLRPINPHTASLIVNPQAAAHDYDNLTHKPQINGHELSGDQSGSDLGLQNQLTAGDNITIENGVISASGGGGSVTSVNGKTGAVVLNADDVGATPAETVVAVSGTIPTIEPQANTVYNCGEVASLTISNPPATGTYSVIFTSGATATVTTFPASIMGLESFAAEANTIYEINVLTNRAVVGSWVVSA